VRIAVVLNPASGSAPTQPDLAAALDRSGVGADIHVLPAADAAGWLTELAMRYDVLVAAGGDGTVSAVAASALTAGRILGVLPAGTLNHFARDAGIPRELDAAVAVLAGRHTVRLDAGVVGGRPFLNNVSIGAYPRMVWERKRAQRIGWPRHAASAVAVAETWLELRAITVGLQIDGVKCVRRSPFIVVGNGRYEIEGLQAGRRRTLSEGRLALYAAPGSGRVDALMLPVRILLGTLKAHERFEEWHASSIAMDLAAPSIAAAVDGEIVILQTPLRFSLRPGAIEVIVPVDKAG
jgi:diacylglycerol kinase family enzyme